jgi:YD repeat-containing protein
MFGRGWSATYDESLVAVGSNLLRLNQPDGRKRPSAFSQRHDWHGGYLHVWFGESSFISDLRRQLRSVGGGADRVGFGQTIAVVVAFAYDNRGRVASTTDVFDQTLEYAYDENGNRMELLLNGSTYAGYAYDEVNRLTELSGSSVSDTAAGFGYDAANKLTTRRLGGSPTKGSANSTYEYDGLDRLTRMRSRGQGLLRTLSDLQYSYSAANQITQQLENVDSSSEAYSYDGLLGLFQNSSSVMQRVNEFKLDLVNIARQSVLQNEHEIGVL